MHDYFSTEESQRIKLTPAQLEAYFLSLRERTKHGKGLPSVSRIARKAEKAVSRVSIAEAKARHLGHAVAQIGLIIREVSSRYYELGAAGNIDDPEFVWSYIAKAEQIRDALTLKVERFSLSSDTTTSLPSRTGIAGIGPIDPPSSEDRGTSLARDCMNVEEVASFLRVSTSTIYHKAASGDIPVNRIGTRLVFHKSEIEAWLLTGTNVFTAEAR